MLKLKEEQIHSLVKNARLYPNKTCVELLRDVSPLLVATDEEKVMIQELVYDVRSDREFDYMKAAKHYGIIEGIIIPVAGIAEPAFGEAGAIWSPYIPLIKLNLKPEPITAKPRKLRVKWTLETPENLDIMHGLNLEKEIVNMMAYKIQHELDNEILDALHSAARDLNIQETDDIKLY